MPSPGTIDNNATATAGAFDRFVAALSDSGPHPHVPARESALRFFVLDGSAAFPRVVQRSRAVLLFGGILSPRAAMTDHLLRVTLDSYTLTQLECVHVVPAHHVLTRAVACVPDLIHRTLPAAHSGLCHKRPPFRQVWAAVAAPRTAMPCAGFGIFFASYEMLAAATAPGAGIQAMYVMAPLVFTETRGTLSILEQYAPKASLGAVLLAVMGGEL